MSTVMSLDKPDLRQIGFSIFETLGFLIAKPTTLQKMGLGHLIPLPCELDWDYDEAAVFGGGVRHGSQPIFTL